MGRRLRDAKNAPPAEKDAEPARDPLDVERLATARRLRDAKYAQPAETGAESAGDPLDVERRLAMARRLRDAKNAPPAETGAEPAGDPLDEGRLIIVARGEATLYDYIRRRHSGKPTVSIIMDRRRADRRHGVEARVPDRRRGERRRYDVEPLLRAQGWAQVTLPKS
jgi:hypothetical protein